MKVKREIEVAICDFCKKEATFECAICGKDVCYDHDLTLHVHFKEFNEGYRASEFDDFIHNTMLVRHFCPDHLTEELRNSLVQILHRKVRK